MGTVELETIEDVASHIDRLLNATSKKIKVGLLYAFNGTGKTRIAGIVGGRESNEGLMYDAYFEDMFSWNNEDLCFSFKQDIRLLGFIRDQGLEGQITDCFQKLSGTKIYPRFDYEQQLVTFSYSPGDERAEDVIKISRGEESLFVSSLFLVVLEAAVLALGTKEEDRETEEFNGTDCIVIDDPVSSIDDTRIISIAMELVRILRLSSNKNLKFLVMTHHALFYNVIFNEFIRDNTYKLCPWVLMRGETSFRLEGQGDSPFGHHLVIKEMIQEAITANELQKYHFNLFRGLLEKSANFLGYKIWSDCLSGGDNAEIVRLINLYSHGKLSDLESKHFPDADKELFKTAFEGFLRKLNYHKGTER